MPSSTPESPKKLKKKKLTKYRENWCRWPTDRLGDLFYGYAPHPDRKTLYTRRASHFKLTKETLESLRETVISAKSGYLSVLLTARLPPGKFNGLEMTPVFVPVLKFSKKADKNFPFKWVPFPGIGPEEDDTIGEPSGTELIGTSTTKMFCGAFCQYPISKFGELFEAIESNGLSRLSAFHFRNDTGSVLSPNNTAEQDIREQLIKAKELYLILGASTSMEGHPFRLWPILEIKYPKEFAENGDQIDDYDFSMPCPPACDPPY